MSFQRTENQSPSHAFHKADGLFLIVFPEGALLVHEVLHSRVHEGPLLRKYPHAHLRTLVRADAHDRVLNGPIG
ncbi:hypothetical protein BFL38_00045 [Brachyspira hampsonii]|uniref:Uncharacterized protein n=1 Tax=Brachyspira hampsonii TaxID=1287055 RepID=A0A1E5NFZ4_9SPIR|nr:hypothetical protein BFL38_00045 [Brachyspira hampsonii]